FRGPGFLIVEADAFNDLNEYPFDDNNTFSVPINVVPLPLADLVTSDVAPPAQAIGGSTIDVYYRVTNRGAGPTDVASWTDTVWLSHDARRPSVIRSLDHEHPQPLAGDIKLGDFLHVGALAAGEGYARKVTVTLPKRLFD